MTRNPSSAFAGTAGVMAVAVALSAASLAACGNGSAGETGTLVEDSAASATAMPAATPESTSTGQADPRHTLVLPAKVRETVLHEMRLMLEAVQGVIVASADGDREAMAREARSGGTAIAVDRDPAVVKRLPTEFVELGSSTHLHFDSLAARIERGISRDSALSELGSLTAKCVACHAGYRVVTPAMQAEEGG